MTAVQTRAAQAPKPSPAARAHDVLAFEWTKLRSVRSTSITLLIAAVVTIGATGIVAHAVASTPKPPPGGFSALSVSFLAYAEYTVIPVSVLAVLQFTSEYSSGLIRTTFAAVPQRWTVLAGKAAVVGAAALVIGEVLAFGCFAFVLCACALTALGLAAIVRHTAGAITAALGVIYLVAGLCFFLPSPWQADIGRFTLAFAASQVTALHPQAGLFSPGGSMLVLVAWPAGTLLVAGLVITRRDA
jgi:hypothetical protein